MPRKKKVTENVVPEKVESVVVPEVAESNQAEAKLEEASLEGLSPVEKAEDMDKESVEKAIPKQRKPRAKKAVANKDVEVKEVDVKKGSGKTAKKNDSAQEKQIFVQYADREVTVAAIEERVKKAWEAEGHRVSSIKKLDIYIKPEEYAVYYVINGKNAGRVDF